MSEKLLKILHMNDVELIVDGELPLLQEVLASLTNSLIEEQQ